MSRILINAKYKIKVNESDGKYVIKRSWESGKATRCFLHIIHLLEKTTVTLSGVNLGLKNEI